MYSTVLKNGDATMFFLNKPSLVIFNNYLMMGIVFRETLELNISYLNKMEFKVNAFILNFILTSYLKVNHAFYVQAPWDGH